MVNFILICWTLAVFVAGAWCGKAYGGITGMVKQGLAKVSSWVS